MIIVCVNILLLCVLLYLVYPSVYESFHFQLADNVLCSGGLYMHQGDSPQAIHCRKYLKQCKGTCTNNCSDCSCYPLNEVQKFEYSRIN